MSAIINQNAASFIDWINENLNQIANNDEWKEETTLKRICVIYKYLSEDNFPKSHEIRDTFTLLDHPDLDAPIVEWIPYYENFVEAVSRETSIINYAGINEMIEQAKSGNTAPLLAFHEAALAAENPNKAFYLRVPELCEWAQTKFSAHLSNDDELFDKGELYLVVARKTEEVAYNLVFESEQTTYTVYYPAQSSREERQVEKWQANQEFRAQARETRVRRYPYDL